MVRTGRIYKIIAGQSRDCYVGSTFDQLNYRFKNHKVSHKSVERRCSVDLFDKYGVDNCKIVLVKEYEVIDRRHLEVYETLWIKKLKSINEVEPCGGLLRNEKQYYAENKEEISTRSKKRYEANKEVITEKVRVYYEKNKESISEQQKQYREQNKQKINERKRMYDGAKVKCDCGVTLRRDGLKDTRKPKNI